MGVKSTIYLPRSEAICRLVECDMAAYRCLAVAKFTALSDKQLEDALEWENDKAHDGEGFENYLITRESN